MDDRASYGFPAFFALPWGLSCGGPKTQLGERLLDEGVECTPNI